MKGVFVAASIAFEKVWHKDLLYKLKSDGIEGELLSLLECYLSNKDKRVTFKGETLDWMKKTQWSVLGPLLKDLPDGVISICKIFADDSP